MGFTRLDTYRSRVFAQAALVLLVALAPLAAAQAYVGPGAGLSLLGALWGVLAAIGGALLFVIMWPIRRMRRRKREAQQARRSDARSETDPDSNAHSRHSS